MLRIGLLPPFLTFTIGLVIALSLASGESSDPKHPDFGSRFRLWGGFALMSSCLPFVFSASSAIPLGPRVAALSVARYRAVIAGGVIAAWLASVVAIYSLLHLKPVWAGMLVSANVLVVGGIVYGVMVSRPVADAPNSQLQRTSARPDV